MDLQTLRSSPANHLRSATKTFMTNIIKNKVDHYKGMGHVVAHDYVQMCALLGLLPLKECYTFAAIVESSSKKQTGPAKFISKCFNVPGSHHEVPCDPKVSKSITSKTDSLMSRLSSIHDNLFNDVCKNYSKEWKAKFRRDW